MIEMVRVFGEVVCRTVTAGLPVQPTRTGKKRRDELLGALATVKQTTRIFSVHGEAFFVRAFFPNS
jgi:hypothetical protein